jgi:dolichol kinase
MRRDNDPHSELRRKLVHMLGGAGAFLLPYVPAWIAFGCVAIAAVTAAGLMTIGARHPDGVVGIAVRPLMRPGESAFRNGMVLYAAGIALAILLLPRDAAAVGWLILAYGDGAAALTGKSWPLRRFRNGHSVGGAIGCFAASLAALILYVTASGAQVNQSSSELALIIGFTAFVGMIAESLLSRNLDNLLLPLIGGGVWVLACPIGSL